MNDQDFYKFISILDKKLGAMEARLTDAVTSNVQNTLEPRFQDLESKIDWIIGAIDTDENERLALGRNFDRKLENHETRITHLELSAH